MIEVWVADLEVPGWVEAELYEFLDDDERQRAKAFRFEHLRRRFTVSHAMVRSLLAERLGVESQSLTFVIGPHGKPALAQGGLEFNLSHSGERALVALSDEKPVGVDIEQFREIRNLRAMAERILSPEELEAFGRSVDPTTFVLDHWTRKEAVLKACGDGITRELRKVDISGAKRLRVASGYLAAAAVEGGTVDAALQRWAPVLRGTTTSAALSK